MTEERESRFKRYRRRLEKFYRAVRTGFRTHLYTFLGVNGFLVFLWAMTGAGHPWFLYPLGGWGIGLAQHFVTWRGTELKLSAAREIEDLSDAGFRLFKRRHRMYGTYRHHSALTGSVTAFLAMIWAINGGGYPWWLIPGAALSITLALNRLALFPRLRAIDGALQEAIAQGGGPAGIINRTGSVRPEAASREMREAFELEKQIRTTLNNLRSSIPDYSGEVTALLEKVMGSIGTLDSRRRELEGVLAQDPHARLNREREELQQRQDRTESPLLLNEYRQTLALLDSQEESLRVLEEQRELADVKIRGVLNSLRHLQIDLIRAASSTAPVEGDNSIAELRRQAEELSVYLRDFSRELNDLK